MANAFNDFFTKIGPELIEEIPISKKPEGITHYLNDRIPYSFLISPTTPQEIIDINNVDGSKSSGPCSVPTKMLKLLVNGDINPIQ